MAKSEVEKLVDRLSKTYGTLRIAGHTEDSKEYISTGNLALDLILGNGIPMGQVVEWSGFSGSGKSLMLQLLLKDFHKKYENGIGIILDRESAFSNERAAQVGIDLNRTIIIRPTDIPTVPEAEILLKKLLEEMKNTAVEKFIAIDSVSAFADDSDPLKSDMGRRAKVLHHFFREILPFVDEKVSFHFANQMTYRPGVWGDNTTVTSGEAVKYYSSTRLKLDDKKKIIDTARGNEIVGTWMEVLVIKTRSGPNYRVVHIPFFYDDRCIPYWGGYARLLASRGYISPNNRSEWDKYTQSTFSYKDSKRLSEFDMDSIVEKYPELLLSSYPEFSTKDSVETDNKDSDN